MTTGRPPPSSDLADTIDEADQPRPERVVDPFVDAPPDDPRAPRNVDMHDRVSALEAAMPSAFENARWIRRGVKVGAALIGLAGAVLIYALAFARASGDADATARERELQRQADHALLLEIARHVSEIRGELRARNPIGMVPLKGPPPQEPPP